MRMYLAFTIVVYSVFDTLKTRSPRLKTGSRSWSARSFYRRNCIKLRQVTEQDLSMATEPADQVAASDQVHLQSFSPEVSASGPATVHTPVDAIPTESTVLQKPTSARGTPVPRTPTSDQGSLQEATRNFCQNV